MSQRQAAAPPWQLCSSSQAGVQPQGQPLGTLPLCHSKLQQEAGGQQGSPMAGSGRAGSDMP